MVHSGHRIFFSPTCHRNPRPDPTLNRPHDSRGPRCYPAHGPITPARRLCVRTDHLRAWTTPSQLAQARRRPGTQDKHLDDLEYKHSTPDSTPSSKISHTPEFGPPRTDPGDAVGLHRKPRRRSSDRRSRVTVPGDAVGLQSKTRRSALTPTIFTHRSLWVARHHQHSGGADVFGTVGDVPPPTQYQCASECAVCTLLMHCVC